MAEFKTLTALWNVRDDRTLTAGEQRVLLMLIAHCNARGHCRPSTSTLADESRMRRTAVRSALRKLEGRSGPIRLVVERGRRTESGDPDTHSFTLSPGVGWVDWEPTSVDPERTVGAKSTRGVGTRWGGGGSIGNPEEDLEEETVEEDREEARVREVFQHWSTTLWLKLHKKKAKASTDRLKHIRARLKSFDVEQLKLAIDHVAASDWMMERAHIEPETIFRNDGKAAHWIAAKPRQGGVQRGADEAEAQQWGKEGARALEAAE